MQHLGNLELKRKIKFNSSDLAEYKKKSTFLEKLE